jgi:hypothetical protein
MLGLKGQRLLVGTPNPHRTGCGPHLFESGIRRGHPHLALNLLLATVRGTGNPARLRGLASQW